jgi:hypothetical protein
MNQHFPFQGPPKFTNIGIFGLKINHLATLVRPFGAQLNFQKKTFFRGNFYSSDEDGLLRIAGADFINFRNM